jgi:hypothetical protein
MTPAQLTTLKAAVLASQGAAIQSATATRNDTELARLLNLPSTFVVWRIDTPTVELIGAVKLANYTPIDAPDGTLLYANRCDVCALKRDNLRMLFQREYITTQKLSTRQDLTDALTLVPAGAGGAAIDAGWLGAGKVKETISRFATVAENAFTSGTGTVGQPGNLGWQGSVSINDIGEMWNL